MIRTLALLAATAAAFAVALVGVPLLGAEARGVLVGVIIGVGASIPTSLLLVALLRQERDRNTHAQPPAAPPPPHPYVTVIDGRTDLARREEWH